MATSKEMTAGPALPLILKFTLPLLLGNLLQQTYSLVDAAIVGKFLGINALASVGASTSVVFLILGFCNGCCGGFGIPVAQKFGARDYSTMRSYVAVSLKLAAGMSVVIALLTCILCEDILRIMRTPENIFEGAYAYLLVTFIGVPCTFFYNLLSSIIRALGDSSNSSSRHSPAKYQNTEQIKNDIQNSSKQQKPERRLTVSQRTDNARKKIVEKRTRHTDESDKQVSISSFKNILRCTHDPKNILT